MKRILPLILWQFGMLAGGRLFADVVTLKDGRQISGSVESGNTQELHIKVGDQSQTIDIHQVQAIQFGVSLPAPAPAPRPPKAAAPAPAVPEPEDAVKSPGSPHGGKAQTGDVDSPATAAGKRIGKGVETAPEARFTDRLTQPASSHSERSDQ